MAVEQHVRRAVARRRFGRGRRPWDGRWSAPRLASKPMSWSCARAPVGRLAGSAACRRDRWRRWGCGSARTAARAPRPAWHRASSGPCGSWSAHGRHAPRADGSLRRMAARTMCGQLAPSVNHAADYGDARSEPRQLGCANVADRSVAADLTFSVAARTDMGRRMRRID